MTTARSQSTDEARIRSLLEDWVKAMHAKDAVAALANVAPDVVSFDLDPPLQHRGSAVRKGLEAWFPTWKGPVGYEIGDLQVTAGGDVAFCHSLNHLTGLRTSGEKADVWVRSTLCLRKINDAWKIVHQHNSVPFYMDGSYKAAVDLKP